MKRTVLGKLSLSTSLMCVLLFSMAVPQFGNAQDRDDRGYDDPPARVARLGYMQGSVSFEPAGENEWVQAAGNRPMTTGDKLWADRDSRAEVQLGSSRIELSANTGFSLLNLDDRTAQMEITAGAINLRVWSLNRDSVYEIDTPNQAFTVTEPGRYRIETSENGDYTSVTVWEGAGESTGNGQSYTLHAGQRTTFRGTNSLNAEVEQIGQPDDFDRWSESRWRRYDDSPSRRYCSHQMVGYDDLDEYGQWQPSSDYGNVWYPRVDTGWAPYHEGHWAWIDPWGWTWVDEEPWGYAPFHYGRWAFIGSRWGWIPGPVEAYPVYAPALVVFVGGGGMAFGNNVAWFPLGPREVYVPSYNVSQGYVNRVNISNTTVNQTTITNVYNTTIVNKNTTITNVNYVNRNVQGAVTAMPQRAFATAQPVSRNAVRVNSNEIARTPMSTRAAVSPSAQAVLGAHANTAGRVAAPPQAIAQRTVVAKNTPPPPPPAFSTREQTLARQPGVPIPRQELQRMQPASAAAQPRVRQAPPGRPAQPTPVANRGGNPPANQPENRPGNPPPSANERPGMPPAAQPRPGNPPPNAQPNRPPDNNRPSDNNRPPDNNRPDTNRPPAGNRPFEPPSRNDRPTNSQPNYRPEPQPSPNNRPQPNQPQPNRPNEPPARNDRPNSGPPNDRPGAQPYPNGRPDSNPNNRPEPNPNNRQETNQPPNRSYEPPPRNERPNSGPPNNRPEMNQPPHRSYEPPPQNERPNAAPPNNRPESQPYPNSRPESNRAPQPNRNDQFPSQQATPRSAPGQPTPQARPDQGRPPQDTRPEPNRQEPPARQQNDRPPQRQDPQRQDTRPPRDQQREGPPNGWMRPQDRGKTGTRVA